MRQSYQLLYFNISIIIVNAFSMKCFIRLLWCLKKNQTVKILDTDPKLNFLLTIVKLVMFCELTQLGILNIEIFITMGLEEYCYYMHEK